MAHISSWNKTLSALLLLRNYPKADFGRVSPLKGSRPVFLQGSSFLPPIKKARKKERKKKMESVRESWKGLVSQKKSHSISVSYQQAPPSVLAHIPFGNRGAVEA